MNPLFHIPINCELSPKDKVRINQANNEIPQFARWWFRYIKAGDVVVDIGANIGLYSMWYAHLGATVHAFEPSQYNIQRLKTCERFRDFYLHPVGLSDRGEKCEMRFPDCHSKIPQKQFVEFVEFDNYAKSNNIIPGFIKMDIEGMESIAMLKMTNTLKYTRPVWQIEFHPRIKKWNKFKGFLRKEDGGFNFDMFLEEKYHVMNLTTGKQQKRIYPLDRRQHLLFVPGELRRVIKL